MIDVFFVHVANAEFSRGYDQEPHFSTLENFVPFGKWSTDVKFHWAGASSSKQWNHTPEGVVPLSSEGVGHQFRHWIKFIYKLISLSDVANKAYSVIV